MIRGLLLASIATFLVLGCASSGTGQVRELRVTLLDHQTGQRFELLSESHTSRVEYYSEVRDSASAKIQSDEVMDALVEELGDRGFVEYASAGRAPSRAPHVIRSLEVANEGTVSHWAIGPGTAEDEKRAFYECFNAHLQIYNLSQSLQTVKNEEGTMIFDDPLPRRRR